MSQDPTSIMPALCTVGEYNRRGDLVAAHAAKIALLPAALADALERLAVLERHPSNTLDDPGGGRGNARDSG